MNDKSILDLKPVLFSFWDKLLNVFSILSIVILFANFGFNWSHFTSIILSFSVEALFLLFSIQEFTRIIFYPSFKTYFNDRKLEFLITLLSSSYFLLPSQAGSDLSNEMLFSFGQFTIALLHIFRFSRDNKFFTRLYKKPSQVIALSFLSFALLGTALLLLPKATYNGIDISDAAFVAVSSLCVTGLSTVDLHDTFTPIGLTIILALIQLGGLGIMTIAMTILTLFPGALTIKEHRFMQDMLSEDSLLVVRSLLSRIIFLTFSVEACGAFFLYFSTKSLTDEVSFSFIFHCIFHAVSAFCNAGLSSFPSASYMEYFNVTYFSTIIIVLIVIGGIGFPLLANTMDYIEHRFIKRRGRKYGAFSVSSKLVGITSLVLLFSGTLVIYLLEKELLFKSFSTGEGLFHSLFASVTSRTAGFSTLDIGSLNHSTLIVMMILMWIGASPASCGGGIKTLNIALAMLNIKSAINGRHHIRVFKRQIGLESVNKAFAVIWLSIIIIAVYMSLIFVLEPHMNHIDVAFEVVSAWSTAGLSRGITAEFQTPSKLLLISLMLIGRIGTITLLMGLFPRSRPPKYKLLKEDIYIY